MKDMGESTNEQTQENETNERVSFDTYQNKVI